MVNFNTTYVYLAGLVLLCHKKRAALDTSEGSKCCPKALLWCGVTKVFWTVRRESIEISYLRHMFFLYKDGYTKPFKGLQGFQVLQVLEVDRIVRVKHKSLHIRVQ